MRSRISKGFLLLGLCGGLLALPCTGQAAQHRFNLALDFASGASGTGTLVYDSDTLGVTAFSVGVTANSPPDMFTAITYDAGDASAFSSSVGVLAYPYIQLSIDGTSPLRMLVVAPVAPLDGTSSPVALQTSQGGFATECFNCVGRPISAGSFTYVPPSVPTTLALQTGPPMFNQVELSATVGGSNPYPGGFPPLGTVVFKVDGTTIPGCGAAVLAGDQALCEAPITPGTHVFSAEYPGNYDFLPSSDSATARVGPIDTATTISATPSVLAAPGPVQLNVTVAEADGGAPVGDGIVHIKDAASDAVLPICTLVVVAGNASCTVFAGSGTHAFVARYEGTGLYLFSSGFVPVTVGSATPATPEPVPISPMAWVLAALAIAASAAVHRRGGAVLPRTTSSKGSNSKAS